MRLDEKGMQGEALGFGFIVLGLDSGKGGGRHDSDDGGELRVVR